MALQKSLRNITFTFSPVGVLLLLAFIGWIFYANFLMGDSYDMILMRDIDEFIFHQVLMDMRAFASNGQWLLFFSSTHNCPYGNWFWVLMTVVSWPISALGSEATVIVFIRELSLLALIFSLWGLYKIVRLFKATREAAILSLVLVCTAPAMGMASLRFHNHTLMAALCIWSVYFMLKPKNLHSHWIGSVLAGLALGLKPPGLFFLPLYVVILNLHFRQLPLRETILLNLRYLGLVFIVGLISFNPGILFLPWDHEYYFSNLNSSWDLLDLHKKWGQPLVSVWWNVYNNYASATFAFPLLIIAVFVALIHRAAIQITCLVMIGVIAFYTRQNAEGLKMYSLVYTLLFPLILLFEKRPQWTRWALIYFIFLNLCLQQSNLRGGLLRFQEQWGSETTQKDLKRYEDFKKLSLIKAGDCVAITKKVYIPVDFAHNYKNIEPMFRMTYHLFDTEKDWYVFAKQLDLWRMNCDEVKAMAHPQLDLKNCPLVRKIIAGEPPFKIVYEDEDVQIVHHEHRPSSDCLARRGFPQ